MKKVVTFVISALALAGVIAAQQQVATVNSKAPFTLRGATVTPGQGVPAWPVMAGDDIKAGTEATGLMFPDGSMIMLKPGTEITLSFAGGKPMVNVIGGSLSYVFKSQGAVEVAVNGKPGKTEGLSGNVGGGGGIAGFWNEDPSVAIVVIFFFLALGLGLGIGFAVTNNGCVSGSACP